MRRSAWVQLTWIQLEALLIVAAEVDKEPGKLNTFLPEPGQRTAFRGATKALEKIRSAM
jgi:hypothetical protein